MSTEVAEFFKKMHIFPHAKLGFDSLGSSRPLCELESQSCSTEGIQLLCMETHAFKKRF